MRKIDHVITFHSEICNKLEIIYLVGFLFSFGVLVQFCPKINSIFHIEGMEYANQTVEDEDTEEDGLAVFPDGKVLCTICGKTLSSWSTGKRHFSEKHMPNKEAKCKICKKVYKNERKRNDHYKSAHGISSRMMKNVYKMDVGEQQPSTSDNVEILE